MARFVLSIVAFVISGAALCVSIAAMNNSHERLKLLDQLETVKPVAETQPRFRYKQKCVIVHGFYRGQECTLSDSRWTINGRAYDVTLMDQKQLTVMESYLDTVAIVNKVTGEIEAKGKWIPTIDESVIDAWIEVSGK